MQSWRRSVAAQTILGFDDGTEKVTCPKSHSRAGAPVQASWAQSSPLRRALSTDVPEGECLPVNLMW